MTNRKSANLVIRLNAKIAGRLWRCVPTNEDMRFGEAVRLILMTALASPAPAQAIVRSRRDRRLRREGTSVELTVPFSSKGEREGALVALASACGQIAARAHPSRPLNPGDLVAAIFESYLARRLRVPRLELVEDLNERRNNTRLLPKEISYDDVPAWKPRRPARSGRKNRPSENEQKRRLARMPQPHPDFPDVQKSPAAWKPGTRGRPPKGTRRTRDGKWLPPKGWQEIAGKWHPPVATGRARRKTPTSASPPPPSINDSTTGVSQNRLPNDAVTEQDLPRPNELPCPQSGTENRQSGSETASQGSPVEI